MELKEFMTNMRNMINDVMYDTPDLPYHKIFSDSEVVSRLIVASPQLPV